MKCEYCGQNIDLTDIYFCPYCGKHLKLYDDTPCPICGRPYDGFYQICERCYSAGLSIKNVLDFGDGFDRKNISINGFIAESLTDYEIEKAAINSLDTDEAMKKAVRFCNDRKYEFSEFLLRKHIKGNDPTNRAAPNTQTEG